MGLAKIKTRWRGFKHRIAYALQKKFERCSPPAKKIWLCFFCVSFAGSSVSVIIHAFTDKKLPVPAYTKIPQLIQERQMPDMPFISPSEFARIEKFKEYINQLPKPLSDSFMQARPHLLDSIIQIEHYYQSQNKK